MNFRSLLLLSSSVCLMNAAAFARTPETILQGKQASEKITHAQLIRYSGHSDLPSFIQLEKGHEIALGEWTQWIQSKLSIDFQYGFTLIRSEKDKYGYTHHRYQQTYLGIPIRTGIWLVHEKNGQVQSMNGQLYHTLQQNGQTTLSEASAFQKAKQFVGATTYKWELPEEELHLKGEMNDPNASYFPKGTLVWSASAKGKSASDLRLAYQFDIYAHQPVSRQDVYVDANTGQILASLSELHDADVTGTAVTAYSGTQTIITDSFGGSYRLRESGRGNGIQTYNMQTGTSYGAAVDFTDADNNWNNVNAQQDEVATDAHWGAEMTYDYYMQEHSRNSIDGNGFLLRSYVHYDNNYSNAFWDGQRMTYGDGSGSYNPFTALDITGHEITHGLDSYTADLDYQDESGALNESFSDIFGVAIEWFAKPSQANWLMGENIGVVIRSMSNPNSYGDPDTYFGTNWAALGGADNGGVHTNSGVQNFWFYLLVNGGTGTNDNGDAYTVNGLGMTDAAAIAFRNLTVYLTNTSQFADARFYAIQSAIDLFGACSPEVEATTNAWYAVGVGPVYTASVTAAFTPNTLGGCTSPMNITFANTSVNGTSFDWSFGDGNTSTQSNPTHTYSSNGVYTVTLIAHGGICGDDTLIVSDQIYVGQLPDPVTVDAGRCDPGTVTLSASGSGSMLWYTTPTGGSPVFTGPSYTTPPISSTTTYYVESQTGLAPEHVGPLDNTIGGGGYFNGDQHLVFNAYRPFTLLSVWVDANSAGNRTFELRNSAGTVLQSTTVNVPAGQGRVNLNFNVPIGTNLQLGWANGSSPDLYRNNTGPSYPYSINTLVDITSSSAGNLYYYCLYDWEVQETPCASDRVPVIAGISSAAPVTLGDSRCGPGVVNLSATGGAGTLNWYDASTGGNLVNTGGNYSTSISSTTDFWVEEVNALPADTVGPADNTFGGGGYFNGDQHLIFDVLSACTLKSVKVYANGAGNRTIELRNSAGTVLQSATVNIPNGTQRVTLNFNLTPGTNYQLGWANGSAPDLYRNNTGPSYPYTLSGLVSITSSSAGAGFYYGYYEWEIETYCITARTQVTGTVNATLDASITAAGPYCASDAAVNLTAVDPGGTWSGTGITNGTNGTFDPGIAGAGTHTITYLIAGACGDTSTTSIVVTNSFDATINSTTPVCGYASPFNLSAVDGGGTWTGTGISNGTTGEFDPGSVSPGIYTVTYTIPGACGSTDTENVTVLQSYDASITPAGPFCANDAPATLTSVDGGGTWSGTGMSGNSFDPSSAGPGNHVISYVISGQCGDSSSATIVVNALPDATILPPSGTLCNTSTAVFLNSASSGGTWSASCGSCINAGGVFNPSASGAGNWDVYYSVTNGCGTDVDTLTLAVEECTGITEVNASISLSAYPNPGNEFLNLKIQSFSGAPVKLDVVNALGQIVFTQTLSAQSVHSIGIQSWSRGVYTLRVTQEGNQEELRYVKL